MRQSAGDLNRKRFSLWMKGARGRSAKIAICYMLAGSAWIVLSDTFAWGVSANQNRKIPPAAA